MTDTSSWKYFYKITEEGTPWSTNVMYTPLVNPERNVLCMLWDENSDYQNDNPQTLTADLIEFFFEREVKHLTLFQNKSWAPKILDINLQERKIFIEWCDNTINHILFNPSKTLITECPTWQEQIFQILQDTTNAGYYKLALYPHCFYIKDQVIKTFDFYSCVGIEERYIPREKLAGMIGIDSSNRFNNSTTDDNCIDFKVFFDLTMNHQLAKYWPDNPFPEFYKRLM